jgi:hypothetical protein
VIKKPIEQELTQVERPIAKEPAPITEKDETMRIGFTSIFVDDHEVTTSK